MYVETRTTHTEVFADLISETSSLANRVFSGINTMKEHSTFTSKTAIRNDLRRLEGAYELCWRVLGGIDQVPAELADKVRLAHQEVAKLAEKKQ